MGPRSCAEAADVQFWVDLRCSDAPNLHMMTVVIHVLAHHWTARLLENNIKPSAFRREKATLLGGSIKSTSGTATVVCKWPWLEAQGDSRPSTHTALCTAHKLSVECTAGPGALQHASLAPMILL